MQIMSVLLVFLFKVGSWTEGGRAPHSVFDQCMGVRSMNPIDAPQTAEVILFRWAND